MVSPSEPPERPEHGTGGSEATSPPPPPPPPAPPEQHGERGHRGWRTVGVIAATVVFVLVVQVIVAAQLDTPWIAFEPGSATSTDGLLSIEGAQTYDDPGQILYLTVRQNRLTALEWVMKARDPNIDVELEKDVYPDLDPQEARQVNRQLMDRSKSDAELVALQYLGYDVFDAAGVDVLGVETGAPADGKLEVGDVITAVDGTAVNKADDLTSRLRSMAPGDDVSLSVEDQDGSNPRTVDITLGTRPDGTGGGYLGITVGTHAIESPDVPVTIGIDSGDVGGNSAGLAFTLSIIDAMTPGSLTGDHTVAITGTISLDGTVGDVGGVAQKAVAARRAGAEYMIVPRNLEAEAKKNAKDMQVIPVGTLQEALDALSGLGGNAKELALPGSSQPN
jgi:PDZ domain-containing protein